jgi:hypothetical protein
LKDLVSDDPDDPNDTNWANGEPDEVEIEWQILQTEFSNPDAANNELAGALEDLPDGDEVVTRRYEFYKYTGPLDAETNEAQCDNYPPITDPADPSYKPECEAPILGDYIGSQMAGFNVEAVLGLIDHVPDGELAFPYTPRTVVVGGNTPYVTAVTSGALAPGLTIDSETGVLSGTPSAAGMFSFTITSTDADSLQVSKAYTMTVSGPADLCADVACPAPDACHEAGICDPNTGECSYAPVADGIACNDGDACTQTDSCVAGICTGSNPVSCTSSDSCHEAGVCDPSTGECSDPSAPDGTACSDGDACTLSDACVAGVCTSGSPDPACSIADLSLRLRAMAKRVKTQNDIDHIIRVKNLGPADATGVIVEMTCSGLPHHVLDAPAACVTNAGVTRCALGSLSPGNLLKLSIHIAPESSGTLTCTAHVSAATTDPNLANQSRTVTTPVR